jgi:hypothetical protein
VVDGSDSAVLWHSWSWCAALGRGPADASGLGLPDSTGASGAYHFTSDGALGPASPGVSIVGGIAVINATTFVVDTGVTVSLTGPYPFDIRATGNVVIDGLLDAGAQGAVPGPGGFAGGSPGLGDGPGGAQQGADVVAGRGGCGGAGGSAYAGAGSHPGTAGEPGATCTQPGYVDAGGGGGAAGAGVEALLHGWGGSGGGAGGVTSATVIHARGGAGAGSVRINSATNVTIGSAGAVAANGSAGGDGSPSDSGAGGGGGGGGGSVILDAPLVSVAGAVTTYGGPEGSASSTLAGAGGAGGDGGVRVYSDCYQQTGAINPRLTHDHTAYGSPYSAGATPVADAYGTPYETTLTVSAPGVLGNDCAGLGTPLAATLGTPPAHGSVALQGDGSFSYSPAAGYSGPDAFTYKVGGAAATVSITVGPPSVVLSAMIQPPINADGSSTFAHRGVIPVKFILTPDGTSTCSLPTATIRLTRASGTTPGAIDESSYTNPADDGSTFRISNCQYVYNLAARGLTTGRYVVEILIDGTVVGNATFEIA